MKSVVLLFMIVAMLFVFALPVLAQEPVSPVPTPAVDEGPPVFTSPTELPKTAAEGLAVVEAFITFVGGLITYYLVKGVKQLPGLSDGEIQKITGLGAEAISAVMACVVGIALTYGAKVAGFLDDNGFWTVLQWAWTAWPAAYLIHKGGKLSELVPLLKALR